MAEVITANNLTLQYSKGNPIIKNATFSLSSNEVIIITGESGSGKSTLLKSFYGEIEIASGRLNVCYSEMKGIKKRALMNLRRDIGVVFQDYRLINEWSIEKNIMLPLIIAGRSKGLCMEQAKKLLKHISLSHKMGRYPYELSGGEQQRVAVVRAMANNPPILLCDEPTGNLDELSSDIIWKLLYSAKISWGACVVVVTHKKPSALMFPHRHFEIKDGVVHEIY